MGDVLVSGATGFVGAAVARRLLAAGKSLRSCTAQTATRATSTAFRARARSAISAIRRR
jgi:nucleoside-diphosphate-sugar epimerase